MKLNNREINQLNYTEVRRRVLQMEGFDVYEETGKQMNVYDSEIDRFLTYYDLESLDLNKLINFNSLDFNKEDFLTLFNKLDKNMLLCVDEIVFINTEEENNALEDKYEEQTMDLERNVGIVFFMDSVVVVNVYLIKKIALEDIAEYSSLNYKEEISRGIWQTLIHELRHVLTANPIIYETEIPLTEGDEDIVEDYCRDIYESIIESSGIGLCFN